MDLRLKLNVFEGPFDLLLHLIKVNEMDIYDVPIADITHQYLQYLTAMEELNLEVAGEYLVMAATLLNIKSRQILPAHSSDEVEVEEEIDEVMSTQELIKRLIEYREIKEMAQNLRDREREFTNVFYRTNIVSVLPDMQNPSPKMKEDIQVLFDAFVRVLRFMEQRKDYVVRTEIYKVEDKIEYLTRLFDTQKTINAFDLFRRCFEKVEIIVTFLAILELCRKRRINIRQEGQFQEIYIEAVEGQVVEMPEQPNLE